CLPGRWAGAVPGAAVFASAEAAVQVGLLRAWRRWPAQPPGDPRGWLITTAWHRFVAASRSEAARRRRESVAAEEPAPGPAAPADDTLAPYLLCAHPSLAPAPAVALTPRAVGGATTP